MTIYDQHRAQMQQLGEAKRLQMQQLGEAERLIEQHFYQARAAKVAAASANQAVDMHRTYGEAGLRSALADMMANGGDPDYLRQVAQQLSLNGRNDLAAIHNETADGW
jgi:2-hydroxychromene-2-carboxylate isomerase